MAYSLCNLKVTFIQTFVFRFTLNSTFWNKCSLKFEPWFLLRLHSTAATTCLCYGERKSNEMIWKKCTHAFGVIWVQIENFSVYLWTCSVNADIYNIFRIVDMVKAATTEWRLVVRFAIYASYAVTQHTQRVNVCFYCCWNFRKQNDPDIGVNTHIFCRHISL